MPFPAVMAQTATTFADEYFKGKRDFPKKMPIAVELVTSKNVGKWLTVQRYLGAGWLLGIPVQVWITTVFVLIMIFFYQKARPLTGYEYPKGR